MWCTASKLDVSFFPYLDVSPAGCGLRFVRTKYFILVLSCLRMGFARLSSLFSRHFPCLWRLSCSILVGRTAYLFPYFATFSGYPLTWAAGWRSLPLLFILLYLLIFFFLSPRTLSPWPNLLSFILIIRPPLVNVVHLFDPKATLWPILSSRALLYPWIIRIGLCFFMERDGGLRSIRFLRRNVL